MIEFNLTIEGTNALLMSNSRLADPLDPAAKALKKLTAKRVKTDDDYAEIAHVEFLGGLYIDPDVGPYLPADNIWRCLFDAGKKHKFGVKVKEGIFLNQDVNPLAYRGPRDAEALWADENFRHKASVKVGTRRVVRSRPQFREWRTETTGLLDPNILDVAEFEQVVETAGLVIGLGDWRPRYGRFNGTVKVI
jgi:hypothetical protein